MKSEQIADRTKCSVYILTLNAATRAKRQSLALEKLRSLHPSGLGGKKIAIRKNPRTKSEYICVLYPEYFNKPIFTAFLAIGIVKRNYSGTILFKTDNFIERLDFTDGALKASSLISEQDIEKLGNPLVLTPQSGIFLKKKILRVCLVFAIILCALSLALYSRRISVVHAENMRIQNELSEQKKKQAEIKAKKEKLLKNLSQTYEEVCKNKKASPYEIAGIIYKNIKKNARIKSLSITGNDFVLEAESNDGTKILASFEDDGNITNAGLQHIFRESGKDIFTLTGTAILPHEEPSPSLNTEEKIKFYLEKSEAETLRQNTSISYSQYTDSLRKLLRACNLEASAIQNMNSATDTQSEYTVHGNIQAFINFLYQAKEKEIEFTTFRLQQQERETSASFRVKLPPSEESKNEPSQPPEFSPNDIAGTFAKTERSVKPKVSATKKESAGKSEPTEKKTKSANFLSYIGQVKNGNSVTAYIKNNRNGEILKVPYSADGKLYISIDSETYEVKQ